MEPQTIFHKTKLVSLFDYNLLNHDQFTIKQEQGLKSLLCPETREFTTPHLSKTTFAIKYDIKSQTVTITDPNNTSYTCKLFLVNSKKETIVKTETARVQGTTLIVLPALLHRLEGKLYVRLNALSSNVELDLNLGCNNRRYFLYNMLERFNNVEPNFIYFSYLLSNQLFAIISDDFFQKRLIAKITAKLGLRPHALVINTNKVEGNLVIMSALVSLDNGIIKVKFLNASFLPIDYTVEHGTSLSSSFTLWFCFAYNIESKEIDSYLSYPSSDRFKTIENLYYHLNEMQDQHSFAEVNNHLVHKDGITSNYYGIEGHYFSKKGISNITPSNYNLTITGPFLACYCKEVIQNYSRPGSPFSHIEVRNYLIPYITRENGIPFTRYIDSSSTSKTNFNSKIMPFIRPF